VGAAPAPALNRAAARDPTDPTQRTRPNGPGRAVPPDSTRQRGAARVLAHLREDPFEAGLG
jgi:hypothetical protein